MVTFSNDLILRSVEQPTYRQCFNQIKYVKPKLILLIRIYFPTPTISNFICLLRSIAFEDFVHRQEFEITRKKLFQKLDLSPSSGEGKETPDLLGRLERANLNHWRVLLYYVP
jgi:hypothetical protein